MRPYHDVVGRQLRQHRLHDEIDERRRHVQVELAIGIGTDMSWQSPRSEPRGQPSEVGFRRVAEERDLRALPVVIPVPGVAKAKLQVHIGPGLSQLHGALGASQLHEPRLPDEHVHHGLEMTWVHPVGDMVEPHDRAPSRR
jgi:hypothetical protein